MKEITLNLTIDEEINLGCALLNRLDDLYKVMVAVWEMNDKNYQIDILHYLEYYYYTTSLWHKLYPTTSFDSEFKNIANKPDRVVEIVDGLYLRKYNVTKDILREYAELRFMVEVTE